MRSILIAPVWDCIFPRRDLNPRCQIHKTWVLNTARLRSVLACYYYYYYYYIIIDSFTQSIHTRIPETNHVRGGYIVAAILSLLFMVPLFLVPALAVLFFYVSTFRSMCAVSIMAVFCSSLTSWFPGMSLTYFLNDLEMVPFAPVVTGITLVFTFHMHCIIIIIICSSIRGRNLDSSNATTDYGMESVISIKFTWGEYNRLHFKTPRK